MLVMKNMPLSLLLRRAIPIKLEQFHQSYMLVSSARTEFGLLRAILMLIQAGGGLIALLPYLFVARWKIQRSRKVSASAIDTLLSSRDE